MIGVTTAGLRIGSLEIKERLLGPDHPDVAMALDNCARYASDSEDLFKRALSIRQNAFGLRHPSIAFSMENLAHYPDEKTESAIQKASP